MARRNAKQSGEKLEEGAEGQGEKGDEVDKSFWKGEFAVLRAVLVNAGPMARVCASWSTPFSAPPMLMCFCVIGSGGRDAKA